MFFFSLVTSLSGLECGDFSFLLLTLALPPHHGHIQKPILTQGHEGGRLANVPNLLYFHRLPCTALPSAELQWLNIISRSICGSNYKGMLGLVSVLISYSVEICAQVLLAYLDLGMVIN